jgi:hypothetical protein
LRAHAAPRGPAGGEDADAASRVDRELAVEDCCREVRSAPHAVLQGAPAREAMPQKTAARQAHGAKTTLEISGIALNTRRKIFCTARAQNRL